MGYLLRLGIVAPGLLNCCLAHAAKVVCTCVCLIAFVCSIFPARAWILRELFFLQRVPMQQGMA